MNNSTSDFSLKDDYVKGYVHQKMRNMQRSSKWITMASIFCSVALIFLISAPVLAGWPNVIFPSARGITLTKGSTYTIQWKSVHVDPVNIALCEEDPDEVFCFYLIASEISNSGTYSWTVPNNLPNGSNYIIGVGVIGVSVAFSDNLFTISDFYQPQCYLDNLPSCTTQTDCQNVGGYWYDNICNATQQPTPPVVDEILVPSDQSVWNYTSVEYPITQNVVNDCKPFAVGDLASGNLNLQVGLPAFSSGVDISLAIQSNVIAGGALLLIDHDKNFLPVSTVLPKWKTNNTAAINESLYGNIPTSLLPAGVYNLYVLVVPAGETDFSHYYFWTTSFNVGN